MMLLKIDINKWFSWLNLGIKDPSAACCRGPFADRGHLSDRFFIYLLFTQGNNPGDRGNGASYENQMG